MDSLVQWFTANLSGVISKEAIIFIISMIPILELRGGLLAASPALLNVPILRAIPICIVGNILPIPFILLLIRHSCIPERGYIVLSARTRLEKGDPEAIRVRMDELAAKRREKQPLEYPSAGSTFKRPEGYFAGKLIEDAGLRGYQEGGAQVSEKHCGFVINRDHATASDIAGLCGTVQKRVYEQFGVKLETEVKMLGF